MASVLLQSTVQVARAVFGARAASILLHDEPAGELWFAAVAGEGADSVTGLRIPAASGVAGWVLSARQPIVLEDVASDPRYAEEVAALSGYYPKGLMAAPLLAADRALGVLEVLDRPQRTQFSLIELDLLGLLADQAAIALTIEGNADRDRDRGESPAVLRRLEEALERLDGERRERAEDLVDALTRLL
jgi:GAF domain-containing protein